MCIGVTLMLQSFPKVFAAKTPDLGRFCLFLHDPCRKDFRKTLYEEKSRNRAHPSQTLLPFSLRRLRQSVSSLIKTSEQIHFPEIAQRIVL